MDTVWETVGDTLFLLLKVVVALTALRLFFFLAGVNIYVPVIDPFLMGLLGHFKDAFGIG